MKTSNIIIICAAIVALSWLMISGWLQANAYNIIKSGSSCSYAVITGEENAMKIAAFRNICVDADKVLIRPTVNISRGVKYEISFSNSMKNAVSTRITGDTLYLKIVRKTFGMKGSINIRLPKLNSLNIKSMHDTSGMFKRSGISANISWFNSKMLSITNTGQNGLSLDNNQYKKLVIKGDFYKESGISIDKSTECDSLDIDIEGEDGNVVIGDNYSPSKEYPIKWSRISIPETFRISAKASISGKIILKK